MHGVNENVEACEACGSPVRRVFHPVGVIFKGSGFYSTDNRSKSGNGSKAASAPESAGNGKKAEEAKPADAPKPAEKAEKAKEPEKK
jgi:predicted nucleic acid-binding Zn ribbon protein